MSRFSIKNFGDIGFYICTSVGLGLAFIILCFGCYFFFEFDLEWQGLCIIIASLYFVIVINTQVIVRGFNNALKEQDKK